MNINDYQDSSPAPRATGRSWAGRGTAAAAALLLTGSIIGWTASSAVGPTASAAPAPIAAPATPAPAPLPAAGVSYAGVVDQVTPAVVTIRSERRVRNVRQDIPDELREFFGDRFGYGRRGLADAAQQVRDPRQHLGEAHDRQLVHREAAGEALGLHRRPADAV